MTQRGGAGVEAGYVWKPVIRVRGSDDARRNPCIDKCTAPPREIREQEQQTKEARRDMSKHIHHESLERALGPLSQISIRAHVGAWHCCAARWSATLRSEHA